MVRFIRGAGRKFSSATKPKGTHWSKMSVLPHSIKQSSTAIPAFVGFVEIIPESGANVAVRINSLREYEDLFGKARPYKCKVDVERDSTTLALSITRLTKDIEAEKAIMYYALQLYFINGGGTCYIIPISELNEYEDGLASISEIDEISLLVLPDVQFHRIDYSAVYNAALQQCGELKDRFAILDVTDSDPDASVFRAGIEGNNLKYGAAYIPYLKTSINYEYDESQLVVTFKSSELKLTALKETETDVYNFVKDYLHNELKVILPPSAAIAGIYARVDRESGVWKAPANVNVLGIDGPDRLLTKADQDALNNDQVSGKSINTILSFSGRGTLVWGARTLDGNNPELRYVSVRRLLIMIEESIQNSTSFVVFEPNNNATWHKVRGMIESYLIDLWRQGALAGAKPEQAFFVKVGLGETMTSNDVLEGKLIVEVGVAIMRPSEYITISISHRLAVLKE